MRFDLIKHREQFPHSCVFEQNERIYGIWMIGNYYKRTADYHGSYPPSYLKRVLSMLPNIDANNILHLFSGKVNSPGITFDVKPELHPDLVGDAHKISEYFPPNRFDLVLADPPYTKRDASIYGTSLPTTWKVMRGLYEIVKPGGLVVWLCTSPPLYRKEMWSLKGLIGMHVGTNKVFRSVVFMESLKEWE